MKAPAGSVLPKLTKLSSEVPLPNVARERRELQMQVTSELAHPLGVLKEVEETPLPRAPEEGGGWETNPRTPGMTLRASKHKKMKHPDERC